MQLPLDRVQSLEGKTPAVNQPSTKFCSRKETLLL